MCVAAAGKVVSVENNVAVVDFGGNKVRAHAGIIPVKPGDSVLVHAGLIIQILSEKDASEMERLFEELEAIK